MQTVNLENLGFGWRKYYSIIFYFVMLEFSDPKDQQRIYIKLHHLIGETHFSYYENKLTAVADMVLSKNSVKSRKMKFSY